jgi:hypothetical protein
LHPPGGAASERGTLAAVATTAIRDVTFRTVGAASEGAHGDGHALFLTLAVDDPARLAEVIAEAIARFTRELQAGPPDTRYMLLVVHGEVAAAELADAWRAAIAHDAPARALLGTLEQADVMQCDGEGRMIASVSLCAAPPNAT